MNGKRWTLTIAVLLLTAGSTAVSAESIRGAEAKIRKAWKEQTAIRAKLRLSAIVQAGPNLLQVTGEGILEFLRDGEQEKWRQTVTVTIPEPVGTESQNEAVFDGKRLFLANEMMGQREARVTPADISQGIAPPGGEPLLKVLEERLDLSLLREDTVDGRAVYVIEGTPRGDGVEFTKGVFYIDQATGLQLRQEIYADQDLAARVVVVCEAVETGVEIDPEHFTVGAEDAAEETE